MFLRQSTASQEILLGPFVDPADGDTTVTSLTIANTDIKLFKHGASSQANKNSGGATHDAGGNYVATLDATDTNTLGNLEVNVHVSGALAIKRSFVVLTAEIYDAFIGGGVIPDSIAASGSRPTVLQSLLMMTRVYYTRRFASGSVLTHTKEDGSTVSTTHSLNVPTAPTNIARTA
jgi:hypothetical protein